MIVSPLNRVAVHAAPVRLTRMNESAHTALKILQVGPLPPPIGGMAVVVGNLLGELEKRCQVRHLNNVKTTPEDRSLLQGILAQLRLLTSLARLVLVWRPDVVHIHTCSWFSFWRNSADVLLVRLLGGHAVLHIHGAQFHRFLQSLTPFRAWLARRVFRLCNRVVVLGEEWRNVLADWVKTATIVVVPNGVPVPPEAKRQWNDPPLIICMANYEKRKGQSDLLRALAGLPAVGNVTVALLGAEAEPGAREGLQSLASELGMEDRVEIPGPKMGADKQAYLDRAGIFCLPSYDEGLPMAMLEAMAEGIPVVVTRVGAIPEAVVDGREGRLYDAGDVAALSVCLDSYLTHSKQALEIGQAGRARVQREFSLERSVDLLMSMYSSVLR